MQTENWKKVKEILAEILTLGFSERRNYLEKAEMSDEIRQEVESLLAVEEESEGLMNLSAVEFSKDFFDKAENALIGQPIGVYQIVREIGYGGMGAVYLAERADGKFVQRVAVKMLKREYNIEKIRRNFEREKEILATLVHPNIATLIDAGTTADGVPFLVMEYIAGVPIDKFCQNRKLSLPERLRLFNKVCQAVGFAHQNLVVHRDLKPSNILITANGEPKLLDFGISKLLDAKQTDEKTAITILGAMTPEYASPEQIKGEQVTTATDIYSLGVVLYKILTDALPFDLKGKTGGEVLKIISEQEPTLPSRGEGEKGRKGDVEKGNLSSEISPSPFLPFSLSQLKGDLDNIILKSLSKEPERRYKTVEQFSADIWRFLDGLPVLARSATFSYRASKFYGRNQISVLAAAFIFISLIAGISIAVWQSSVAREQAQMAAEAQRQAEIETEHAKTEEEKAKKIAAFMSKIISYANPAWFGEGARFGGNARVIDALDDLSDKIDTEFAGEADIAAELHHKFAEVYNFVAQREKNPARAEKYLQKQKFNALRALELRKQFYGMRHELVAKDMMYACYFISQDDRERAQILAQAIEMMRETNPKNLNLPYMLEAYANRLSNTEPDNLTEIYLQNALPPTTDGKYELAEKYYAEMLELFQWHYKEGDYAIVVGNCYVALIKSKLNKFAEAQPYYQFCKEAESSLQYKDQAKGIRMILDKIEEMSAANNRIVSK